MHTSLVKHFLCTFVIRFSNSSARIFVIKCRSNSEKDNKFFCCVDYAHMKPGAPKSFLLGCNVSLANSPRSLLWCSEKEAFMF